MSAIFMDIQPVILWTDGLIFALLAGVLALGWSIRHQEHLRAPWAAVGRRPMAMGAALVLGVFVAIGLLDSLHYREKLADSPADKPQYSVEVLSVFDALVGDLRTRNEKTYSAPLAMHLYAKEFVDRDGQAVREYPRLQFGGAHLRDAAERRPDLVRRSAIGLAQGLAASLLLFGVLAAWQARRAKLSLGEWLTRWGEGRLGWPGRTLVCMATLLLMLAGVLMHLAAGYHVFGTDKVGQDVLYITLKSIRTGLVIGTLTTLVTLPLAISLGIAAGYFRGWVDDVIQYVYTVLNSIPGVLLIAAAVLIVQGYIESHPELFDNAAARADVRLLALCLIMGMTSWTGLARIAARRGAQAVDAGLRRCCARVRRVPHAHPQPPHFPQRVPSGADRHRAGFLRPGAGRGGAVLRRRRRRSQHVQLGQHDQRRTAWSLRVSPPFGGSSARRSPSCSPWCWPPTCLPTACAMRSIRGGRAGR